MKLDTHANITCVNTETHIKLKYGDEKLQVISYYHPMWDTWESRLATTTLVGSVEISNRTSLIIEQTEDAITLRDILCCYI